MATNPNRPAKVWSESQFAQISGPLNADHDLTPERAKQIMDQRARELARAPLDSDDLATHEVISFRLGNNPFAIESCFVREVFKLVNWVVVPGSPEFLIGVTNLRGEVLAVMDLRHFFGVTDAVADQPWVLVLGQTKVEFGIVADTVNTVSRCEFDGLFETPQSVAARGREYIKGVTDDCVVILDGQALLQDSRLYVDQD